MKIMLFLTLFALLHTSRSYSDISVSSLDPKEGITFTSQTTSDILGNSVKSAGDFNGDGYDDIIIGSYGAASGPGAAYVIFGGPKGLSDIDVTSGMTASQGVAIYGPTGTTFLGYSVSNAGDVNDDGIDDIIVGAYQYNGGKGAAYVIYGSKTPPAIIDLSVGLNTNQGFAVTGGSAVDLLGYSVSYAGDVNNDKIDDVIIGAYGVSSYKGAAYVIFGKKGIRNHMDMVSGLGSSEGFAILGVVNPDLFGRSVSNAGDVDGDGIDDVIIGASGKSAAYIIYGKEKSSTFATIDLSLGLSHSQGFLVTGIASSQFGGAVSSAGDFNGDGRADVIVGAYMENSNDGAAYVIFGMDRSLLLDMSLSSGIDPLRGIRIDGVVTSMDFFGYSVSRAGDINNDGIDDVVIGAVRAAGTAGTAYVIFGSKSFASSGISLGSGLGPDEGFRIIGDQSGDNLGSSVSSAEDVNGDDVPDLIVGAQTVNSGGGAAYLLFSPLVCPKTCKTCSTAKKCLTCNAGYGLLDFSCVECPAKTEFQNGICVSTKSGLGSAAEVANGLFNSGSTASRIFTMGRSLSVGLGLIGKIIQNVRFLDIDYDSETLEAFKTYGTDLFELPIPEGFYKSPETKDLSSQYSRYDTEPSFLENYWDTVMTMLICLGCFLVIKLVQFLTKGQEKESLFQTCLKNMGQTAANFFIIQIYSNLDDVIFYLLLDIQSTKLNSPSSGISLASGILFLVLGLALVFFHCWLLGRYQKAKSQGALEQFEEKYGVLGTLYEEFKDDSIASHSFFGILILRCVILILVIVLLQPQWMQATIMMLTNLIFLGYFIYYRPFKSRFDEISQYFCEFTVFVAYLCVLILSIFDASGTEKASQRKGLGKAIVIAGIVLALGGFIIQMIQTIGAMIGIYKFFKNYSKKDLRVERLEDQSAINKVSEDSAIFKRTSPINFNGDQLELVSLSQKNQRRISPENNLRQDDPEISSFHLDHSNFLQNNLRSPGLAGHRVNMPRQEENFQRAPFVDRPKLEVILRPMGSRIHMERGKFDSDGGSSPQINNNHVVRRKKIKRNAIRPKLSDGLDDSSMINL